MGVGRTRTSNQAVIVKRWAKHSATILTTSTTASRKRRSPQYLSGKLSGRCLGDQLSIGRSGRICDSRFEPLKSLTFSDAGFDFVYSPCVLVSRQLQLHKLRLHLSSGLGRAHLCEPPGKYVLYLALAYAKKQSDLLVCESWQCRRVQK